LKKSSPDQIAEIERAISNVHPNYVALLAQLIADAEEERRQESERGQRD